METLKWLDLSNMALIAKRGLTTILLIFILTLFSVGQSAELAGSRITQVERVVDGDTLVLSTGEKVRLIGIDTPEKYHSTKLIKDAERTKQDKKTIQKMGRKASKFTERLANGKKVRLEFDVQEKDRYGRLLAYVYILGPKLTKEQRKKLEKDCYFADDGSMFLNATLVKAGYAQIMTIPPNVKYADLFLKLQREARGNNRGLWK